MWPRHRPLLVALAFTLVGALALVAFAARATVTGVSVGPVAATAGQPFSGQVAAFSSDNPPFQLISIGWGDGSPPTSGSVTPVGQVSYRVDGSHTYSQPGSYTVTVTVTDANPNHIPVSGTGVAQVAAPAPNPVQAPVASLTVRPDSPVTGQTVGFDGSASSSGAGLARFDWTFAGAATTTASCDAKSSGVAHVFTDPGSYTVTLTVTDAAGRTSSAAKSVTITDAGALPSGVVEGSACGLGAAPLLAPGLRGAPTVAIAAPTDLASFDHAPSPLTVSGTVKAPEGISQFCVTGPVLVSSIPSACDQKGILVKGGFTVLVTGLKPGTNVIRAWVKDSVGQVASAQAIVLVATTAAGIDLRADSLEVTQGIQPTNRPDGLPYLPESSPSTYQGVGLAVGGKTIVRLYAHAPKTSTSPPRSSVENVEAGLYGFRGGKLLSPAPLLSEEGPRTLTGGINLAFARLDYAASWTFTLPPDWTKGTITLEGVVNPPDLAPSIAECTTCYGDDTFEVDAIPFTPTRALHLVTAKLIHTTSGLSIVPPADGLFAAARAVLPLGEGQLVTPPYATTLDLGTVPTDQRAAGKLALAALGDWSFWAEYYSSAPYPDTYFGITDGAIGGLTSGDPYPFVHAGVLGFTFKKIAEARAPRQLTSIAHELGHFLGLPHAGKDCKDSGGEDWPPDQVGYLQGVGLDRRGTPPYGAKSPTEYDLMSYCASTADTDSWISVRNWQRELATLSGSAYARSASGTVGPRSVRDTGSTIRVTAVAGQDGVTIASVGAGAGDVTIAAPGSAYRLVVRDANGAVTSDTGLVAASTVADPGPPLVYLSGQVQAQGAASVEIASGGAVVARRARSAHAPSATIDSPRPGATVAGRKGVDVRWHALDADGDPLNVRLEYSRDGGTSWRPVYTGPDRGRATLPPSYLAASDRALLRLVVGDGFNQATVLSGRFRSLGAPPSVSIESPAARARISGEASVWLAGSAFDDAGRRLRGAALRWYAGATLLGQGSPLSVTGLPAGTQKVRLVARDSRGRVSTAKVTLHVLSVQPRFLRLRAPKSLRRDAHSLRLAVSATVPATLRVGSQSFDVDRTRRSVAIDVGQGRVPLALRLLLTASGRTTSVTVKIARR